MKKLEGEILANLKSNRFTKSSLPRGILHNIASDVVLLLLSLL